MTSLTDELREHDCRLGARGHGIWVGAEPTFTDPTSEAPEWLHEALGEDKERRAATMAVALWRKRPGAALLRPAGRPYGGEDRPRWCVGVYAARDGSPVWHGPPDPLGLEAQAASPCVDAGAVARALVRALSGDGWKAAALAGPAPLVHRISFRFDGGDPPDDPRLEPGLLRESVHLREVAGATLEDALAAAGVGLVALGVAEDPLAGAPALRVELPACPDVAAFRRLLAAVGRAVKDAGIPAVVLAGHPPPADARVAWETLTPDPAVVEVNMAPWPDLAGFHRALVEVHAAARSVGLAGHRLHYNGLETDSGGGGQITLGGASPGDSPFLTRRDLLPSLVRYLNRHPALSYWWCNEAVGAAGQGPRADEGHRESLRELDLALALLDASPARDPQHLHDALAPFLVDVSGNPHRAELNVEKLWNPRLGARGRMGVVELRSLRMAARPGLLSAIAALLRSVVAMLAEQPLTGALVEHGDLLHERFSLPFYLRADLRAVLAELDAAGLAPGAVTRDLLLDDAPRRIASVRLPGAVVHLDRAVEFWPLMGDVASQERGGARLVDASTARLECRLQASDPQRPPADWTASVLGVRLPLRAEHDDRGHCRVAGIRYRTFVPRAGLHPGLGAQAPITVAFNHPRHGSHGLTLHEWRPGGGAYPGLPRDREEAAGRRAERCVVAPLSTPPGTAEPPARAFGGHVLDLRWLAAG